MVILLVGDTLNTMTATFHRNFEFTSTEASDEDDHLAVVDAPRVMRFARYSYLSFINLIFA